MHSAIPTRYGGHRFRSRLEARWAVLFDSLGLRWEYEREAFHVEVDGTPVGYTPDFWLPDMQVWFEVKPEAEALAEDEGLAVARKLQAFRQGSSFDVVVAFGTPRAAYLFLLGADGTEPAAHLGQCVVCHRWFFGPAGELTRPCGHESEHGAPEQARGALIDASAYRFWDPPKGGA